MPKLFLVFVFGILFLASDAVGQKDLSIAAVQGDKSTSPYDGQPVRISGIVTARTRTGFFLQTPDDKTDGDANTSEGIFVYTRTDPQNEAAVGSLVSVTGDVEEFRRNNEPLSLTLTEISMRKDQDEVRLISKASPLPRPVVLTVADFKSGKTPVLAKRTKGKSARA